MAFKYFLYSQAQVNDRNTLLDKLNRIFVPGMVITGGRKREFSVLSDTPSIPRYTDIRIIAEGDTENMVYSMPSTRQKYNSEV